MCGTVIKLRPTTRPKLIMPWKDGIPDSNLLSMPLIPIFSDCWKQVLAGKPPPKKKKVYRDNAVKLQALTTTTKTHPTTPSYCTYVALRIILRTDDFCKTYIFPCEELYLRTFFSTRIYLLTIAFLQFSCVLIDVRPYSEILVHIFHLGGRRVILLTRVTWKSPCTCACLLKKEMKSS